MTNMTIKPNTFSGPIRKMLTELQDPVAYYLPVGAEKIHLNPLLNQKISLRYVGAIFCIHCDRKINKSFQQGFCYPCYRRLLECDLCVIHPAKCRYYEGNCKADDWAHAQCGAAHVVYLANSSGIKVGITRATQIPSRWIDQGATQGLVIMTVNNRRQAGLVEDVIKQHVADKTNWRMMLKADNHPQDLLHIRAQVLQAAEKDLAALMAEFAGEIVEAADAEVTTIHYPASTYPEKIYNFDLDKNPVVEGRLLGIKGQYLLLDTGVISVRKFGGYGVEFTAEDIDNMGTK
jgi:hypothetical protein